MFKYESELQHDLANHLKNQGFIVFEEIQLKGGYGRADIVAIRPSYAHRDIRIYEVKNNRGCFLSDDKYLEYQKSCDRLYLACPKGIVKKDEVPANIGIITYSDKGWHTVKQAKKTEERVFHEDFYLSLIFRGFQYDKERRRIADRIITEENATLREQAKKIGRNISRAINKNTEVETEEWCKNISEITKKYLGIELWWDGKLPDIYPYECILESAVKLKEKTKMLNSIGRYLMNHEDQMDIDRIKASIEEGK